MKGEGTIQESPGLWVLDLVVRNSRWQSQVHAVLCCVVFKSSVLPLDVHLKSYRVTEERT